MTTAHSADKRPYLNYEQPMCFSVSNENSNHCTIRATATAALYNSHRFHRGLYAPMENKALSRCAESATIAAQTCAAAFLPYGYLSTCKTVHKRKR